MGVGLAVRVLPALGDHCATAQSSSPIHSLPPAGQLRYTAGVLSQIVALRAALGPSPTHAEEDVMSRTTTTQPFFWRCRILRRHRWVVRSTEDGSRYEACARCGRERPDTYDATGGIGMGVMLGTGGGGAF